MAGTGRRGRRLADERFHIGFVVVGVVPVACRTRLERRRLKRVRRPGGRWQLVRLLVIVGAAFRVLCVFCRRLWPLVLWLLLRLLLLALLACWRTQRHLYDGWFSGDHYTTAAVFVRRRHLATGSVFMSRRRLATGSVFEHG